MDVASPSNRRSLRMPASLAMVVFAILSGCSTYIGTTSKSFLKVVRSNPDPNIRFIAYGKLGSPDLYDTAAEKTEAVSTLVTKLQEGKEPLAIRAIIVRSLGELGDPRTGTSSPDRSMILRAWYVPKPVAPWVEWAAPRMPRLSSGS